MPLLVIAKKAEPSFGSAKKKPTMSMGEDSESEDMGGMDLKAEALSSLAEILGVPEKKKALGRALHAYIAACEKDEESSEEEEEI